MELIKKYSALGESLGVRVEHLKETKSTNLEAKKPLYKHGDVVVTSFQSAGRGQRGNSWESEEGKNLTFSLIVEPTFLPASMQFLLSEAVSLAVVDLLEGLGIEADVKWPNDIYIKGEKVAGILIEHDILGSNISRSIIGIGLNVNQMEFCSYSTRATSVALQSGATHSLSQLLERYYVAFMSRYAALERGKVDELEREYHSRLYKLNELHRYTLPTGESFDATLVRVEPSGELILQHADNSLHSYLFKEVQF